MSARCWAYGVQGRCSEDGGHDGNHAITFYWTDEECLDPAIHVPVVTLPIHDSVLVDQALPDPSGPCFSCGCSLPQHLVVGPDGEQMCVKHQCREWIA